MAEDPLLERWKAVADFQVKFMTALGEYQVNAMKALNLQIEAETKAVERDIKREALKQIQLTFKRLARARLDVERKSKLLRSRATDASFYFLGEAITPSLIQNVWTGYRYFITKIPSAARSQINGIPIDESARDAANFFRNPLLGASETAPPDKKTAVGLINWLIKQRYIPVRDSAAAEKIDQVFNVIADAGQAALEALQSAFAQLESDTFTTFDPLKLAGLPPEKAPPDE